MANELSASGDRAGGPGGGRPGWEGAILGLCAFFLFFSPFPHTTTPREAAFWLSSLIFAVAAGRGLVPLRIRTPLLPPFLAFALWAGLTSLTGLEVADSLHDCWAHLLKYLLWFYLLSHFFASRARLQGLAEVAIASGASFSLGIAGRFYGLESNPLTVRLASGYTFIGTNTLGLVAMFSLLLALLLLLRPGVRGWRRAGYLAALSINLGAALLTQSRGVVLALAAALLVLLAFGGRKKLLLLALGGLATLTFFSPVKERALAGGAAYDTRLGLYRYFGEIISDHPLLGTGFSLDTWTRGGRLNSQHYLARIPEKYRQSGEDFNWPHNLVLDLLVRTGVIGLLLFAWLIVTAFGLCRELIRRGPSGEWGRDWGVGGAALLTMFLVWAQFEPSFWHTSEVIFYTILAMITIAWRQAGGGATMVAGGNELGRIR